MNARCCRNRRQNQGLAARVTGEQNAQVRLTVSVMKGAGLNKSSDGLSGVSLVFLQELSPQSRQMKTSQKLTNVAPDIQKRQRTNETGRLHCQPNPGATHALMLALLLAWIPTSEAVPPLLSTPRQCAPLFSGTPHYPPSLPPRPQPRQPCLPSTKDGGGIHWASTHWPVAWGPEGQRGRGPGGQLEHPLARGPAGQRHPAPG